MHGGAASRFLRPEDIRRLDAYEFAPRAVAEGAFAGRHRGRRRGSSTEFRDYRPFVAGDDRAHVDWRVLARTDRLYLRTFEQETSADGHVFLDSSASMGFGEGGTKLEYASRFVAALAYLVIKGGDRVSLQICDEGIRRHLPPGGTASHLGNVLDALERNTAEGRTRLAEALRRGYPLLRQRGTLVVVSDFLDDPRAIFEALHPYLHRGFRVHLRHVLSPEERDLRAEGLHAFLDLETGERLIAHAGTIREGYLAAMRAHQAALRELAVRRQVDYRIAGTDESPFLLFEGLLQ